MNALSWRWRFRPEVSAVAWNRARRAMRMAGLCRIAGKTFAGLGVHHLSAQ